MIERHWWTRREKMTGIRLTTLRSHILLSFLNYCQMIVSLSSPMHQGQRDSSGSLPLSDRWKKHVRPAWRTADSRCVLVFTHIKCLHNIWMRIVSEVIVRKGKKGIFFLLQFTLHSFYDGDRPSCRLWVFFFFNFMLLTKRRNLCAGVVVFANRVLKGDWAALYQHSLVRPTSGHLPSWYWFKLMLANSQPSYS